MNPMVIDPTRLAIYRPISFERWCAQFREQNPDSEIKDDNIIACKDCDGTGEDECLYCGSIIECETCNGTGNIIEGGESLRQIYDEQLKREQRLLKQILKEEVTNE